MKNSSPTLFCDAEKLKVGATTAVLCLLLCLMSFFWFLFITRKFNFSGFFYLTYYFVMYPALCVTIFGLYLKGMLRFRYYIVFLMGIAVGLLVGSVSWVFSMILTDYRILLEIFNYGVSGFLEFTFFHMLISSAVTFDFLIGAVNAVLVKYLWRECGT